MKKGSIYDGKSVQNSGSLTSNCIFPAVGRYAGVNTYLQRWPWYSGGDTLPTDSLWQGPDQ